MSIDWERPRPKDRDGEVQAIIEFIKEHPHSYASLAVCRRALDSDIDRIDGTIINNLQSHLDSAPTGEIRAYYSIIG